MRNSLLKKELVLGIIMLFVGTTFIPSFSGDIEKKDSLNVGITLSKSISNQLEKGFIFGRISKFTYFPDFIASEAVKIHIIMFNPFNFNTYLDDTIIEMPNGYKGLLSNYSIFLWGEIYRHKPPESNILTVIINKNDWVNNSIQWIVTAAPWMDKHDILWALLDVNNTNVTGTNITIDGFNDWYIYAGDTYDVRPEKHGFYVFILFYKSTGLLLFNSELKWYGSNP